MANFNYDPHQMLKKLSNIFRLGSSQAKIKPNILGSKNHNLSPEKISPGALKVVEQLKLSGYESYLVGGCVRDLLMNIKPKDFDVATNATPEQVKQLFSRSRIIGRRFQIVHVRAGPEIIEVTTFRAQHTDQKNQLDKSQHSAKGMLLRDNIFGTVEEDAIRRDFTMNALYYCSRNNSVLDYTNGLADINKRVIRIIGDASERYKEDPVRMLRAIRFSTKLGFSIEEHSSVAINESCLLLADIPPARLFDEVIKLFMNGYALATFCSLREYGIFGILFPATEKALSDGSNYYYKFIEQALVNTDKRIRNKQRVTPAFLFAALLWPALKEREKKLSESEKNSIFSLHQIAGEVIASQCKRLAIPRRFTLPMREIWELQLRLPRRAGKQAFKLLTNKRFRAGYDFLLLREDAGEIKAGLGEWWTIFQDKEEVAQKEMVDKIKLARKNTHKKNSSSQKT
ncbi:MAG: poly(A) polymerase [Saprospiraceae bacterium]|jgi:poly(A) polymerase